MDGLFLRYIPELSSFEFGSKDLEKPRFCIFRQNQQSSGEISTFEPLKSYYVLVEVYIHVESYKLYEDDFIPNIKKYAFFWSLSTLMKSRTKLSQSIIQTGNSICKYYMKSLFKSNNHVSIIHTKVLAPC
jgi:hypothetical protein